MRHTQKQLPHPIPYQGSKRTLVPLIAPYIPKDIDTWFEPFAGSAAMTIWAAHNHVAHRYVIADVLEPIAALWQAIIDDPAATGAKYEKIWKGQKPGDFHYFNKIRQRYNEYRDPVDLLYVICRCVKNSVRFNRLGNFTQSVDKRRLGMKPERMNEAIHNVSFLLRGQTEIRSGDWLTTMSDLTNKDFVYLDPPYLGTTIGRDKRYAEQLPQERLITGIRTMVDKDVRFALSYDGMTGHKIYGPPLPTSLGLTRLLLHAGISSQSTLSGRSEQTFESLYLSPGLDAAKPEAMVRQVHEEIQESLFL